MKNRRNIIVAFLLCAVMLLGIGYAALTDVLDITGTADITMDVLEKELNTKVYFKSATAVNPTVGDLTNTASVNSDNNDKASFTANTLKNKDDIAVFTFVIKNEYEVDVVVTPTLHASLGNTKPEYFDISSDWDGQPKTIAAGAEQSYTVTIKLIKSPTETISGSFSIELTAVADNSATTTP